MHRLTHPRLDVHLGPAGLRDFDDILALAKSCVADMTSRGIFQWDDRYPDRDSIEDDVRTGAALVGRHLGEVVAYFALDSAQDPQYEEVDWRFDEAPVAVVHRLMVSPAWQGRGLGRWCMETAEQAAVQRACATMRFEAFSGNERTIRFYGRCGYRAAGVIRFRTGEFTCFEKMLERPSGADEGPHA